MNVSINLTMSEMHQLLKKYKLPKLTQEVMEHLNKSKSSKEVELVIKISDKKNSHSRGFSSK